MKNKIRYSLVVSLIIATLMVIAASPFYAAYSMKNAISARQPEKLANYVDFPKVKESLKRSLNASLIAGVKDSEKNGLAIFGAAFAMAIANPIIDAMVTPEGLTHLMNTGGQALNKQSSKNGNSELDADFSMSYSGVNNFEIVVSAKTDPSKHIKFQLQRYGLLEWKLISITLP